MRIQQLINEGYSRGFHGVTEQVGRGSGGIWARVLEGFRRGADDGRSLTEGEALGFVLQQFGKMRPIT